MAEFTAADVKRLRDATGAGMMDCKKALTEADGDYDKAVEFLRVKGAKDVGKRLERSTTNGIVVSKDGALLELDCETDFVAKNDDFKEFAREIALHIAASPLTQWVAEGDVPEDAKAAELKIFEEQAADKPENVRPKIAEGRLKKWLEEVVLLNQPHVNKEKHGDATIEELRAQTAAKTGENVVIRRFQRFAVGEA